MYFINVVSMLKCDVHGMLLINNKFLIRTVSHYS